jgi:hypothetical protein
MTHKTTYETLSVYIIFYTNATFRIHSQGFSKVSLLKEPVTPYASSPWSRRRRCSALQRVSVKVSPSFFCS